MVPYSSTESKLAHTIRQANAWEGTARQYAADSSYWQERCLRYEIEESMTPEADRYVLFDLLFKYGLPFLWWTFFATYFFWLHKRFELIRKKSITNFDREITKHERLVREHDIAVVLAMSNELPGHEVLAKAIILSIRDIIDKKERARLPF